MISRSEWRLLAAMLIAMLISAFCAGCMGQPSPVPQPPFDANAESSKALELFDADKDGKISGKELDKCPGIKASLKVMKTDKDKGVTKEMIVGRIDKWIESKIGRTTISCTVTRNGKPLEGAKVAFVPEPFLSDALPQKADGTTNQMGMAMISLPVETGTDALPPGMPPGMYRVEITKPGDNIPAKFNKATELGQEVSLDNIDIQKGIKFDLKY
jgi:hypothetical protein